MILRAKTLEGCELHARDGEIGRVKDVYFDDEHWHVRYLVVETGSWLTGRSVLISAAALGNREWSSRSIVVDLTKEQVRNSPGIDTARPVSRQEQEALHRYYAWPYYWAGPFPTSAFTAPLDPAGGGWSAAALREGYGTGDPGFSAAGAAAREQNDPRKPPPETRPSEEDSHLRSLNAIRGYDIRAVDGSIGHVEDFVLDDETWAVRYLLANTRNWWPGRKVLVGLTHIRDISWHEHGVFVDLNRDEIKASPEFDEARPLTSDYVDRLDAHYRKPRTESPAPSASTPDPRDLNPR
jgi:uncharacterized protein YrrD